MGQTFSKHKSLGYVGSDRKATVDWIIYILNCCQYSSFLFYEWWNLTSPRAYHSTERVPQENCMTVQQGPVATPLCCLWEWGRKLSAHTSCGFFGRKATWWFGMQIPRKITMTKLPKNSFKKQVSSQWVKGDFVSLSMRHPWERTEGPAALLRNGHCPGWAGTQVHSAYLHLSFSEATGMREAQEWSNYSLVQEGTMACEHPCVPRILQSFVPFWALCFLPMQLKWPFSQISPTRDGSETQDFKRVTSSAEMVPLVERPMWLSSLLPSAHLFWRFGSGCPNNREGGQRR